jgi:hypothetical protein
MYETMREPRLLLPSLVAAAVAGVRSVDYLPIEEEIDPPKFGRMVPLRESVGGAAPGRKQWAEQRWV